MSNHIENVRAEVRALVKKQGMRATAARISVLVALHERQAPMTHEEVMDDLPPGTYDRASVWRVLSDLASVDLVRRMDLGDRVWRYELYDSCRTVTDDHPHFLCESCGVVSCLPALSISTRDGSLPEVLLNADFQIRIAGRCATCTQTQRDAVGR